MLLSAEPCPTGIMPVVLSSEAGGTMVHEACGHGLEADLVHKGLSAYVGKIGQQVASEKITVIDDAAIAGKYGSYSYDDEGTPAQRTVLIENGILKQYMTDLQSAERMGSAATGNGRRESYREKPVVRMSNTYIAPGTDRVEDMIASVEYGLFVKHMGGGQVNTLNGDYVFDVSEGYLIENGKITRPVRGATLAGNGPESLRNVEMVGNDLGYAIGTCGKYGQRVPVADAQPTLKINGLTVGGTGTEKRACEK
jgi:TldD protein